MRHSQFRPARVVLGLVLLLLSTYACSPPPVAVTDGLIDRPGGDQLYYRLVGSGPDTLVFLHGGPALSSRYLEAAFHSLGRRHGLLFYDARGRGRSPGRSRDSLRLDVDVTDLEAVRQHFNLGPMKIVGHQWGSAVLLKYWLRYPAEVGRAVLLAPFPHKGDFVWELQYLPNDSVAHRRHAEARAAGLENADPAAYCRGFWGFAFSPIEEVDPRVVRRLAPVICDAPPQQLRQREAIQRQLYLSFGTWNWVDSIPTMTVPALVIAGSGTEALVAGARAWAGRLPDSRLLIAGKTALFPWLEDGPGIVAAVDDFMSGGWPSDGVVVAAPPDSVIGS